VDVLVRMINVLLMLGLPLLLAVVLVRRYRAGWSLFFIGAGTFLLAQIMEIPFNRGVLSPLVESLQQGKDTLAPMLLFALSAGVFEEGWRYVVYRWGIRKDYTWERGMLFGAGHGGMEAILLGGVTLYGLLQAIAYRDIDLTGVLPLEQLELAQGRLELFWSLPWYAALLGGLERMFALVIHMALSVIVLQGFVRRSSLWLALAIGWHAFVDAIALLGSAYWSVYAIEGAIGVMALISLAIIRLLRHSAPVVAGVDSASPGAPPVEPTRRSGPVGIKKIDKSTLEDSRYADGK
jgi:uncharacterized membrane protein YhfC